VRAALLLITIVLGEILTNMDPLLAMSVKQLDEFYLLIMLPEVTLLTPLPSLDLLLNAAALFALAPFFLLLVLL
jgi:hypothetical protein